jgi:hypothetical protein
MKEYNRQCPSPGERLIFHEALLSKSTDVLGEGGVVFLVQLGGCFFLFPRLVPILLKILNAWRVLFTVLLSTTGKPFFLR